MAKRSMQRNRSTTAARNGSRVNKGRLTQAQKADKYQLYQQSVQEPSHEVEFFDRVYGSLIGGKPRVLREDFCGTFAVCCEWVKKRDRKAVGVDLDPEPLAWGIEHNLVKVPASARSRLELVREDVRKVMSPKADVLAAQNFSFWGFKTRDELRGYFQAARQNIKRKGIMVLDMMGGGECFEQEHEDIREFRNFTYVWEQARFNPIDHEGLWAIHFRFPDGSKLERVFRYEWRMWTLPEVRELLLEAGFSEAHVYWEGSDKDGEGDGVWRRRTKADSDPAWVAYIVAVK